MERIKKMKTFLKHNTKPTRRSSTKTFAVLLTALMFASVLMVLSSTPVNAQTTSVPTNMLQYEFTKPAGDAQRTYLAAGPAPSAPNILWKAKVPGAQAPITAFNGLVFCLNSVTGEYYALDGATGNLVWKAPGFSVANLSLASPANKIDNTYMTIGSKCLYIANG